MKLVPANTILAAKSDNQDGLSLVNIHNRGSTSTGVVALRIVAMPIGARLMLIKYKLIPTAIPMTPLMVICPTNRQCNAV